MTKDMLAGIGVAAGWAGFGISLAQMVLVVQIIAGLAATAASIAAFLYYRRK